MSTKPPDEPMTAQLFAEEMGVHYRTALSWLRNRLVPGAVERKTPMGSYWEIPRDALTMEKPKPGPKPKSTPESDQAAADVADESTPAKPKRKASKRLPAKKAAKKIRAKKAAKKGGTK